jgi:hypothetical protein
MPKTHNKTGRSKSNGRYFAAPHFVSQCKAYKDLSVTAKAAWLQIGWLFNGSNNGDLCISTRKLAEALRVSRATAARAIQELTTYGFLEKTKSSSFSQKRLAAKYRLTHLSCDVTGAPPSRTFMRGKTTDTDSLMGETVIKLRPGFS